MKQHICHDHVRRSVNVTSNIRLQVYEEHAIEKKKNLLFMSDAKSRSPNPVFLERWWSCMYVYLCVHMYMYIHMSAFGKGISVYVYLYIFV